PCDKVTVHVTHGPRTQRQGTGLENLDGLRLPCERRLRSFEKCGPSLDDLLFPAQGLITAKKDRLLRKKRRESLMVTIRHGLCKSAFGCEHFVAGVRGRLRIRVFAAEQDCCGDENGNAL